MALLHLEEVHALLDSNIGSHVLNELPNQMEYQTVRFSFSRYNTKEEVDFTLDKIRSIVSSG